MGRDTLRAGPGQQEKGRGLAWLDFIESLRMKLTVVLVRRTPPPRRLLRR